MQLDIKHSCFPIALSPITSLVITNTYNYQFCT